MFKEQPCLRPGDQRPERLLLLKPGDRIRADVPARQMFGKRQRRKYTWQKGETTPNSWSFY